MKADLFWQKLWTLKRQKKHFLTNKAGQRKGEKNNELLFQFYEKKKKVQKLTFEKNGGETFWSLKNDFRLKICRDVVVDIFDVFFIIKKSRRFFYYKAKKSTLFTSTTRFFGGRPRFLLNMASMLVLIVIETGSLLLEMNRQESASSFGLILLSEIWPSDAVSPSETHLIIFLELF